MSNTGARLKPEAIRELAFGSITTSYQQMGPTFAGPIRIIYMGNNTDEDVYFSFDGVIDQFRVQSGSYRLYDCKTNDGFFNAGQSIFVRGISGSLPTKLAVQVEAMFS